MNSLPKKTFSLTAAASTLLVLLLLSFVVSCAKKTMPEGGPYDMVPPRLVKATPAQGAVNVKTKKIKLRFDENVNLQRQSEKIVYTPPQITPPKLSAGTGKTITVEFQEDLLPNTTYIIDFADAIVDLNEGNPMETFSYAFSTGSVIDTLVIDGLVLDAQTLRPLPDLSVGIYQDFKAEEMGRKPMLRLSKSNDNGLFAITHVADGAYTLFALNDIDKSYSYSSPAEGLAFYHEKVHPALPGQPASPDSVTLSSEENSDSSNSSIKEANENTLADSTSERQQKAASLGTPSPSFPSTQHGKTTEEENSDDSTDKASADSTENTTNGMPFPSDSTASDEKNPFPELEKVKIPQADKRPPRYILLYSLPKQQKQTLQKIERPDSVTFTMLFTAPIDSLPRLQLLTPHSPPAAIFPELSDNRLKLTYWIADSTLYRRDTLRIATTYYISDSLFNLTAKSDTLSLVNQAKSNAAAMEEEYWGIFDFLRPKKKKEAQEGVPLPNAKSNGLPPGTYTFAADSTAGTTSASDSTASSYGGTSFGSSYDSVATDSTASAPIKELKITMVPQPPYCAGHPATPFAVECSEPIDSAQFVHLQLYEVEGSVPENPAPPTESERQQAPKEEETENKVSTQRSLKMEGGATNPYESGIDRYGTEEEKADRPSSNETEPSASESPAAETPAISSEAKRTPIAATYSLEPLHPRRINLHFTPTYGKQYLLTTDSIGIVGRYGATLKGKELPFNTSPESSFGTVEILLDSLPERNGFFELISKEDSLLLRKPLNDSIELKDLVAGTYYARLWIDSNGNGQWDGGLFPNRQPEPVFYMPQAIEVAGKFTRRLLWNPRLTPLHLQRPGEMFKPAPQEKRDEQRERRNLNEEYIQRMRERYGEKWNPSNRDRRILGLPSRQEAKAAKKEQQRAEEEAKAEKEKKKQRAKAEAKQNAAAQQNASKEANEAEAQSAAESEATEDVKATEAKKNADEEIAKVTEATKEQTEDAPK